MPEKLPILGDVAREITFERKEVLEIAQSEAVSVKLNDVLCIVFSI